MLQWSISMAVPGPIRGDGLKWFVGPDSVVQQTLEEGGSNGQGEGRGTMSSDFCSTKEAQKEHF